MLLTSKKALKAAFFCLILTSFVTGCVKNNNKDGTIETTDEVTLNQQNLLLTSNSTGDSQVIKHSSPARYKKIIQEWTFNLSQQSNVSINYIRYKHDTCNTTNSFIYKFEVQEVKKDSKGKLISKSIPMLTKGTKLGLNPGQYILRAILDNNAGCKNIDFSFKIKINKIPSLSYNSIIKAQYSCDTVQFRKDKNKDKKLIVGEFARINTQPMKVQRISNDSQSYVDVLNIKDKKLCETFKGPAVHSCKESIFVDNNIKSAKILAQQRCKIGNNKRKTRPSLLTIFEVDEQLSMDFKCSYRNQRRNYSFSNCLVDYSLGEELPLMITNEVPALNVLINKRSVIIDLKFDPSNIDISAIPGQLYVNLYNVKTQEPVMKFTTQVTRTKLTSPEGRFELNSAAGEKGIRKKLKDVNMNNIHIVISKEPNDYTSGIFHLPLKQICKKHPQLINRVSKNDNSELKGCDL